MTDTEAPKVTVFIPVHNREHYVGPAIESILGQSFQDFEVLLVDDGSTDRSVEVIRGYDDPRVRLVCSERNLGIPRTRNKGIQLARGEYVAMLDSDDVSHPKRLERQIAFLDRHPDYAQVGSWNRAIDESGKPLKKVKRQPVMPEDVDAQLLFRCALSNRSIMARTAILRDYGYRNDYPRCQDYELHVRLAKRYKLGNLPEVLVYGRVHPQQITVQTNDLGNAKKREIVSTQLEALGVAFSDADLDPHLNLSRMRKIGLSPDRAYLEWANAWLQRLQEANMRTGRYSQRAFARAISEKWIQACWAARAAIGWRAWRHFFRSPLSRGAGASVRRHLAAHTRSGEPREA